MGSNKLAVMMDQATQKPKCANQSSHPHILEYWCPCNIRLTRSNSSLPRSHPRMTDIYSVTGTPCDFLQPRATGRRLDEVASGHDINYFLDRVQGGREAAVVLDESQGGRWRCGLIRLGCRHSFILAICLGDTVGKNVVVSWRVEDCGV